jgi:hypothetical protein
MEPQAPDIADSIVKRMRLSTVLQQSKTDDDDPAL